MKGGKFQFPSRVEGRGEVGVCGCVGVCVYTYRCIIDADYSIRTSYSLTQCCREEGAGDKGKKESSLSNKPNLLCWASSLDVH